MRHALVRCMLGVVRIDLDADEIVDGEIDDELPERPPPDVRLPRLVTADAAGATIVAIVDRRPPLVVSHDAGGSWHEAGAGLPAGRAVAVSPSHTDDVVYATAARVFVSADGGRFWRALTVELPEITGIAWADEPEAG